MHNNVKNSKIKTDKHLKTCSKKIQREIAEILSVSEIESLIGQEILYHLKRDEGCGYTYWSKVLGLSPNKKFAQLADLDGHDTTPYYRGIAQIEVVDILT